MYRIFKKSYLISGYIGFIMNSFQSVLSQFLFGYLYFLIFEEYSRGELSTSLIIFFTILIGIYFILAIPLWGFLMEYSQNIYKGNLKKRFFKNIFKNKNQNFDDPTNILTLLQRDINNVQKLAGWDLVVLFQSILSGLISTIVIAKVSLKLVLIIIVVGLLPIIVNMFVSKYFKKCSIIIRKLYQEKLKASLNYINNLIMIRIYGLDEETASKINKNGKLIKIEKNKLVIIKNISMFFDSLIYESFYKVLLIYFGVNMIIKNEINFGLLILAYSMLEGISFFLSYVGYYIKNIQNIMVSVDNLKGYFNEIENNVLNLESKNIDSIIIDNIDFSYDDSGKVFDNFSIKLKLPNNFLIEGPNGSGKSTLLQLMAGIFAPDEGSIKFVDNSKNPTNKNISYVGQEPFIFNDSLLNNLTLGDEKISILKVEKALETVGLKKWYKALQKGLDTQLDEKGKNISKGEETRLCIARALIKEKNIIFLDEPDANIDTITMQKMIKSIEKNYKVSIIMVSHLRNIHHSFDNFQPISLV